MAGVEYNYLRRAFGYPLAQLNFSIPDSLLSRIDLARPEYLDRKGFICLLIEKALTGSDTLGPAKRSEKAGPSSSSSSSTSKEEEIKPKNKVCAPQPKFVFSVPDDLEFCRADLLEFWKEHKSGKKTKRAAQFLIGGLRRIRDAYGEKAVNQQLEQACAYGWDNISLANYEKFGLKQAKAAANEPPSRHPAHRDASEVIAEQERLAQQNIEHLRRKKQEEEEAGGLLADLGLSF